MVLEKTLESPLDSKEIKAVNPKRNQPWMFIERADAEPPILWPPYTKSQHIRKDPDAGKDWRQEEKGTIEDKMVGWHHWLNGHEFEQALVDGEGQTSLASCNPWGCKESDMTERLSNWTTAARQNTSSAKEGNAKLFPKIMVGPTHTFISSEISFFPCFFFPSISFTHLK